MARRGPGEGTIYRHKASGRWCAELTLAPGTDGKPRRWRAYARTRREAAEQLRKAQADRDRGVRLGTAKQSLGDYLDHWLESCVKPPLRRPHTYRGYEVNVRVHLKPALGRHRLDHLSPQHVQAWISDLIAAGHSARTVEYAHATLRAALQQAVRWELVSRNVARLVTRPPGRAAERPALTPEQTRAILAAVAPHRLGVVYTVAMGLGLRQAEVLGLRWEDVDLDGGSLQVSVSLQRHGGQWQLTPLKSAASQRRLPLPGFVVEALRAWRRRQEEERLRLGPGWPGWTLVFTTTRGTPLDGPNVTHQFQRILETSDLPRLRFQDLRHATATLLGELDVPIRTTMQILGHSQVATTAQVYQHVTDAATRAAMAKLGQLLDPGLPGAV